MASDRLVVLLAGDVIGQIQRTRAGWSLRYDGDSGTPLSLSLPRALSEHGPKATETWLRGLLPDNAAVLQRWANDFGESPDRPVDLLRHVGEDCAGAVQFVDPGRLQEVRSGNADRIVWLDDSDVASRLSALDTGVGSWRRADDCGQFSLAGAQAKTALYRAPNVRGSDPEWGIPEGRIPTTHILKPPIRDFHGHVENEHYCLRLAARVGLTAAESQVISFEERRVIVVERYDRFLRGGAFLRVHQEDMCQAAGVQTSRKYEADGGPTARALVDLLRSRATDPVRAVQRFVEALAFNWLVGGTDAHAKNYSVLLADELVVMAPLYDIASALPYRLESEPKLAMKIGGERRVRCIRPAHWRQAARRFRLDAEETTSRVYALAMVCRDEIDGLLRECLAEGIDHDAIEPTHVAIRDHLDAVIAEFRAD